MSLTVAPGHCEAGTESCLDKHSFHTPRLLQIGFCASSRSFDQTMILTPRSPAASNTATSTGHTSPVRDLPPPPDDHDPDTDMPTVPEDIPLSSPLRTHPKRLLPPTLASTYPHGHLSGHPRTSEQQTLFDARRREILRSMSAAQIEKKYEEIAVKVREEMEACERRGKEVEAEVEKLVKEREMERRVWEKLRRG